MKHWYTTWWGVLILFILLLAGSFAVAFGFAIRQEVRQVKLEQQSILYALPQVKLNNAEPGAPTLGANGAPIKMTVFGDYSCQYTKAEAPVIRDFLFKHADQVQLVYRDFPVVAENSLKLALASRCANEQKMFWPMHDYLFDHQGEEPIVMMMAGAKSLKLDIKQFADCLKNEKFIPQIKRDLAEGLDLKLQGTPVIFMNDYQLPAGEIPADVLEKIFIEINKKLK